MHYESSISILDFSLLLASLWSSITRLGRSRGTVVNSYDLITCPSLVQAPNGPCPHKLCVIKTLKPSSLVVQAGRPRPNRQWFLSQRRRRRSSMMTWVLERPWLHRDHSFLNLVQFFEWFLTPAKDWDQLMYHDRDRDKFQGQLIGLRSTVPRLGSIFLLPLSLSLSISSKMSP